MIARNYNNNERIIHTPGIIAMLLSVRKYIPNKIELINIINNK